MKQINKHISGPAALSLSGADWHSIPSLSKIQYATENPKFNELYSLSKLFEDSHLIRANNLLKEQGFKFEKEIYAADPVRAFLEYLYTYIKRKRPFKVRIEEYNFDSKEESLILKYVSELEGLFLILKYVSELEGLLNKEEKSLLDKWFIYNSQGYY